MGRCLFLFFLGLSCGTVLALSLAAFFRRFSGARTIRLPCRGGVVVRSDDGVTRSVTGGRILVVSGRDRITVVSFGDDCSVTGSRTFDGRGFFLDVY